MNIRRLILAFLFLAGPLYAQNPPGGYGPGLSGGSASGTGANTNIFDITASNWNTPLGNLCSNGNVSVTTGSNQVTCSNYTFTSADIGKVAWVSCCGGFGGTGKTSSTEYVQQGVINSVVSAHVVTICTTTGTCTTPQNASNQTNCQSTNNGGCQFFFGKDGTTQLQAAIAAAYNTVGPCPTLLFTGWVFINQPGIGNQTPTCQFTIGNFADRGMVIAGIGRNNSGIIVEPTATKGSYSTCTGLGTKPSCIFGIQGKTLRFMGISGGGEASTGSHNFAILEATTDDNILDVGIEDWGGNDTGGLVGLQIEGPGAYIENPIVDGAGTFGIFVQNTGSPSNNFNKLIGCYSGDVGNNTTVDGSPVGPLVIADGATIDTTGCFWGQASASGNFAVVVGTGSVWNSTNDTILANNATSGISLFGTAHLTNLKFGSPATLATALFIQSAGVGFASNSQLFGGGSGNAVAGVAAGTGKYYDLGGNTYSGGFNPSGNTVVLLGPGNGDNFHAACTGTATPSTTLGLYGTGPNVTATTCTSATIGSGVMMKNSGTILSLEVTATHAGVNASSGAVTVLKNGVSQTMTCTIGTGTACVDSTHTVSYVQGDLISIQFTTQAAEVLAGVNATIATN